MRVFSSPADRRRALLALLAVLVGFAGLYVAVRQYLPFLTDARALRAWVAEFGYLAPLAFVIVQALQVVIAPIPGQAIALMGGYLFGPVAGTVYSLLGVLIGSAVAFLLAKRFGRPFVERVLRAEVVASFDGFVERVGVPGLFLFVVVPGLPDDVICFLSGLTTWRLRTFLPVMALGRLPSYALTVYAGDELASGRFGLAVSLLALVAVLSVAGYYNQDRIRAFVESIGD
ncbi:MULTISPECIES: TVP38/TMEM64 family protein [Halolamina]|uniref:Uncharacterized membrane protein YdjX, TVP38/TMEM64 family, SNARE-associated domain n=1 Tax=Halolamina pelagica TaxID=699431 RepID=A0A1I5M5V9_9EURY|nr:MULTISPECIES: TVP38/TMEM64 family protein [Halolamina]NHX35877.1 TVP38/TMEM64 family protein [Halolamina sp. R1-12]SFP04905.1 Uncharacterized membrane protein YdjX, TVP38/TMEM64 family, SNARE-associated domain [Halolamina pelagica]